MNIIFNDTTKFKKLYFYKNGNSYNYEKAPWYKKEKIYIAALINTLNQ